MAKAQDKAELTGELRQLLGYNLRRASVLFMNDFTILLRRWNLSPTEFSILLALADNPSTSQAALSRTLAIKGANMTPMVARLEAVGYVVRSPNPADKRQPRLALTEQAQEMMPIWRDTLHQEETRLQGNLSDDEKNQLVELLLRLWDPD